MALQLSTVLILHTGCTYVTCGEGVLETVSFFGRAIDIRPLADSSGHGAVRNADPSLEYSKWQLGRSVLAHSEVAYKI